MAAERSGPPPSESPPEAPRPSDAPAAQPAAQSAPAQASAAAPAAAPSPQALLAEQLSILEALGFSRERAQKALIATGDTEAAVTLLSGLGPADDATLDMLANMALGRARGEREYKLVLVVNQELKMGVGKVAAQCSHATLGAYQSLQESGGHDVLERWLASGQPKVVLKAPSLQAMLELQARAAAARLPCFLVRDAGRTQVAAGSATVLAVGPAETAALDGVTGHLKLL